MLLGVWVCDDKELRGDLGGGGGARREPGGGGGDICSCGTLPPMLFLLLLILSPPVCWPLRRFSRSTCDGNTRSANCFVTSINARLPCASRIRIIHAFHAGKWGWGEESGHEHRGVVTYRMCGERVP